MAAAEDDHWWFRNTRALMVDLLAPWLERGGRFLDAGCGPGGNGAWMAAHGDVVGVDLFRDALTFVQARHPRTRPVQASLDSLPLADASFDVAACITVLTNVAHDAHAVGELARVTRPGGAVLLMEPAFNALARSHDAVVHSRRRYRLADLRRMATEHGLVVRWGSYAYSFLAPPAAILGLAWRFRPRSEAASDTARTALGGVFTRLARAERRWMARRRVPFGTSAILLAEKLP